jgi:hypothetical protein
LLVTGGATRYDYSALRRRYLPPKGVRVAFVGESAPDPREGVIRFFYHPILTKDNLFRGLMLALYGADKRALSATAKTEWLNRFQRDGYYVDDLCSEPVDGLPPSLRSKARKSAAAGLVERLKRLRPRGVIICHVGTYLDVAELLRNNGLSLLHSEPIPFPLGNYRERFAIAVRASLLSASPMS